MRPTVNDIAREAGVSLATVDRVLNDRPGVRSRTVDRVNDAIRRLGYVRDLAAANLARGRSYRFAVILPESPSQFIGALSAALARSAATAATDRAVTELLQYPPEDGHALAAMLAGLPARGVDGVAVMAPETPVVRDALAGLRDRGIRVVALVSDQPAPARDRFVGVDNRAAGRTAAVLVGRCIGRPAGPVQVMVTADSMQLRESLERRRGFDEVMLRDFPGIEVLQTLETHGSPAILADVVARMAAHAPHLAGVYALGTGNRALTRVLADTGLAGRVVVVAHELTPHTRAALQAGSIDAVIMQNPGHLMRSALRVLRAQVDGRPIDEGQETIRVEIVIRENLPPD